ncbi:MAG: DNA double-strand break repair nuclease NurA [Thermofilaceae archaeon]|nr:DNA double-strand break repair nuclease NurA [Thermofilaceae archaeon]MDW8004418.1 DNA double-strand break repair nuclease NurA [Thermofilaceae archaeon]
MPRYVDLFIEELRRSRGEVLNIVGKGSDLTARYKGLVEKVWVKGVEAQNEFGRIFAVDSSSDEIEVSGGGVLLVTRSIALEANGVELRKLRLDPLFPKNIRDYEDYKRLVREHLEHLIGIEAVENGASLIMLDGSLFGRMVHVLRELEVDGREDIMLEYMEVYGEMISNALKKKAVVVGVSKDSRSTLLKEELLSTELKNLLSIVSEDDRSEVLSLWRQLKRRPTQTLEKLRSLIVWRGLDPRIYGLFEEARNPVPDSKILVSLNLDPGYSTPMKLSLEKISAGVTDVALSDFREARELLKNVFQKTSDRMGERVKEKIDGVLDALRSFPPVLTSYVVFEKGDDPVRVDVAFDGSLPTLDGSRFVEGESEVFKKVLRCLTCCYAGRQGYNVLLLEADRRVKTTFETLELYHKLAMRELGELIVHSRGERRVLFP